MSPTLRRALTRLVLAGVTATAALTATAPAANAAASGDRVVLVADSVVTTSGSWVGLHAIAEGSGGGYQISIFENGTLIQTCYSTACDTTVAHDRGTYTYTAYLAQYWQSPPTSYNAKSNAVSVSWTSLSPTDCTPTQGVVACLTPGAELQRVHVLVPAVVPGITVHVAGYLDLYAFTVADVTVTLPCVVLDNARTNPCELAGGSYVRRYATLANVTQDVPSVGTYELTSVGVCAATLTATVDDIGVNRAPAVTVC
ncbi:MAG TPA: hypothetical protein VFQ85_06895 [Mycobacteriales bacterium]|jgi:hypothetical protein|nr:hypothetical protein [Mycobacteriales bacterium]